MNLLRGDLVNATCAPPVPLAAAVAPATSPVGAGKAGSARTLSAPRCINPECRAIRKHRQGARGYCRRCYGRWRDADFPASGPPAPMTHAERAALANADRSRELTARITEYAEYRSRGYSREMAARWVGVSADTGYRYEVRLRRQEAHSLAA